MALPTVSIHGKFSTEGYPSIGQVTFVDNLFSVDAGDDTIYTPTSIIAILDQGGEFWADVPLNSDDQSVPQPRAYRCDVQVQGYYQAFDFILQPTSHLVEFATLMPITSVPVLPPQYVSSIAGLTGTVSAQQLQDQITSLDPDAGEDAYEQWLGEGNTGTIDEFFEAYRGYPGVQGDVGPIGPEGPIGPDGRRGPAGPIGEDFVVSGVVPAFADLPDVGYPDGTIFATSADSSFWLLSNVGWLSMGSFKAPPGAAGSVWYVQTSSLVNTNGVSDPHIGDCFLYDSGEVYRYDGATWQSVSTLVGPLGPAGPVGPQGEIGPQGSDGADGPTGPEGAQGPIGVTGDPGTSGNVWHTSAMPGITSPTDVPQPWHDGDMFLYVNSGDVFRYSNPSWVYDSNIRGAQGPTGATGTPGTPGADEVVLLSTAPTPVNNLPELWIDLAASDTASIPTSGTWGTAPLSLPPYASGTRDLGREVYIDSAGKLRSRPDLLYRTLDATALPSAYPSGQSILSVGPENATGWPNAAYGAVVTIKRQETSTGQTNGQAQQWWYRNNSTEVQYRYAANDAGGWSTWRVLGTDPVELGAGLDLNTIITPGLYTQSTSAEASSGGAVNYPPTALAGLLEVFVNTTATSNMIWQRYTCYAAPLNSNYGNGASVWTRGSYNGTWTAWEQIGGQDSGWVDITITAGFTAQGTEKPQVRLVNGIVYSRGGWSGTGLTVSATISGIGTVPSGYRPTQNVIHRAGSTSGAATAELFIGSSGNVDARMGPTSSYVMLGATWLTT